MEKSIEKSLVAKNIPSAPSTKHPADIMIFLINWFVWAVNTKFLKKILGKGFKEITNENLDKIYSKLWKKNDDLIQKSRKIDYSVAAVPIITGFILEIVVVFEVILTNLNIAIWANLIIGIISIVVSLTVLKFVNMRFEDFNQLNQFMEKLNEVLSINLLGRELTDEELETKRVEILNIINKRYKERKPPSTPRKE
ncbi:hypothetical protein ES705_13990 [subsurface metagenome]